MSKQITGEEKRIKSLDNNSDISLTTITGLISTKMTHIKKGEDNSTKPYYTAKAKTELKNVSK